MEEVEDEERKDRTLDLLLLLKNDFEIKNLPKICEELIVLAQYESCQNVLVDHDGHKLVLDTMARQFNDKQTQQTCCDALYCMMNSNDKLREQIQKSSASGQVIEALEKFTEDASIQAAGLRAISLLASSKTVCNRLMYEESILSGMLDAMASFPMDAEVQSAGCMALHYLLAKDVEEQKQFFAEGKYHVIMNAIENHADNRCVLQEAFWALNTLAYPDETYDELMAKSHKHLFSAMARFPKELGVQMVCCSVIETFARTDESQNFLEVNGASRLTITAIRNYPGDADLQAVAFNVLERLGTAIDNNSKVTGSNSEIDWIEEAHRALTTHQNQPAVLDAVCRSLVRLLICRPECIAKSDDEDLNLSLDSPILACIMLHMENVNVAESACTALYQVMICSEHLQQSLMEKGADIAIKTCMQVHRQNTNVLTAACQALLGLCNSNMKHKDHLIEDQSDILDEVFQALHEHSHEPSLVRVVIQLVTCLAEIDFFRNQCLTEGVHEVILESMVRSKNDANMQSVMLEALAILSTAEGMVNILSQSNAYSVTVEVMTCHNNNIDIILKGCILLQALLTKEEVKTLREIEKAANVIIQAMEQFSDVDNKCEEGIIQCIEKYAVIKCLQEEGCVVLHFLAEISEDAARMLVNLQIHDRLFYILEKYDDDDALVNLACECLWIFICNWDFKNQILSSACSQGRLKSVEILVQLGANVNVEEGGDIPINKAIQNHNVPLVRFLLKQGVNDLQGCLKRSLSSKDHEITGLLLMHIGLDTEAGIVSWSGLQLSDVHPTWFYTTFYSASELAQEQDTTEVDGGSAIAQRVITTKKKREQRHFRKKVLTGIDGKLRTKVRPRGTIGSRLKLSNCSDTDGGRKYSFGPSSGEESVQEDVWSPGCNYSGGHMRRASTSEYSNTTTSSRKSSMDESGMRHSLSVSSISESSFQSIYRTSSSPFLPVNPDDPRLFESYLIRTSPDILYTPSATSNASGTSTPSQGDASSSTSSLRNPRYYQRTLSVKEKQLLSANSPKQALEEYSIEESIISQTDASEDIMDGAGQMMPDIIVESFNDRPTTSTPLPPVRKRRSQSVACMTVTEEHKAIECRINFLDLSSNGIPSLTPLIQADRRLLRCFICLQKLDLSNNMLSVFPSGLSPFLSNLKHLDLRGNKLKDLPTHMFASNKLEILDVSHNKIKDIASPPDDSCFSLHELNLSNNHIRMFPAWLCNYVPALQILNISCNNLEPLANIALQLQHLRSLKLCGNSLLAIPDKFLLNMSRLETLHASNNQLYSLPDDLGSHMTQLTTVKLSNNNLAINEHPYIPKFLLKLPWVRSIDLSGNRLTVLPDPSYWKSQSLRELLFADNAIRKLDLGDSIRSWRMLERLNLRNNKLRQVPKELGQLTSLTTLDLSRNSELSTLPDELGRLNRLWELPLEGLRLDLPPAILKGRTKDIVTFLHQRLKRAVPYNRMKLMLVGYGGRGKTTLIRRLQRLKVSRNTNIATVGVNVKEWTITVKHDRKPVDFLLSTWDFAGQEDFYSTHPCFLTGRALYLVVFDLSKGVSEINTIRPWLLTIQALAPSCPVILVGTHKDKIPKDQQEAVLSRISKQIHQLCSMRGFPQIQEYVEVSNTGENESIDHLRKLIAKVVERMKIRGKPILGQMIPYSYLKLQKLVAHRAQLLRDTKKPPVLLSHQINQMIKEENVLLDENELPQAVRFLHETGVLLHYDDPSHHLSDLYFIEPEWLCKVMARVVTVREINPFINQHGILGKDKLRILLSDYELPGASLQQYLRLLEKFDIALPISDGELLIPCKMPNKRPTIALPISTRKVSKRFMLMIPKKKGTRLVPCPPQTIGPPVLLKRYYDMPYIPIGLWSRLILRLLLFAQDMAMQHDEIYNLVWNSLCAADDSPSKTLMKKCNMGTEYWREGIYVCWSSDAFILVEPKDKEPDVLSVNVPNSRLGQKLLGLTCDLIDDLIEEWFPGLMEIDPLLGRPLLQRQVPCSYCEAHVFDVNDLLELASLEEPAECITHCRKMDISQLAPDLALTDIEEKFYLDRRQFRFKESSEYLLGDGGFGSVYKGIYRNKQVAVKVFNRIGDTHPHRMLRQEISVLRHLRHPSLISLEAVGINPRMLIMEYASSGALSSIWKAGYRTLTRSQQHRIALQVAEGLMFLHQNNIVYRDLKPDNILIFSLNLGMMVNAKIADYGISKFTTRYGLKSSEGTPGYRAPEVIRGTSTYNTEVDVYSFGILLYELVTSGKKPFEDLDFRNELDDAVVKGRKLPPLTESGVAPWPELQDLIDLCLEHIPENRPTSEQAFRYLSAPELLCLRNTFPLFKGISVECATVRVCNIDDEETLEVWFAGGDCQLSMICKVNIAHQEQDVMVQGTACNLGRALCMASAGKDAVLVGMQTSLICVFDANSKAPKLKHTSARLPDSVLSMVWKPSHRNRGQVYAGLADGQLLIFNAELLIEWPDCHPDMNIQIGSLKEPIKCMTATSSNLWLGCGGQPISFELQCLEEETYADIPTTTSKSDHLSLITCMCIDQKLWLARRKSNIIEIHDIKRRSMTNGDAFSGSKQHINMVDLMRGTKQVDVVVKSMVIHSQVAWVGTSGGHVCLIDTLSLKLIKVVNRHNGPVQSLILAQEQGYGKSSCVISTGMAYTTSLTNGNSHGDEFSYALVWDAEFKSHVRSLNTAAEHRSKWIENSGQRNWAKIRQAAKLVLHCKADEP